MTPARTRRRVRRAAPHHFETAINLALVSACKELVAEVRSLCRTIRAGSVAIDMHGSPLDPEGQAGVDASEPPGVWISADAPEWAAWDAWWRAINGKSPPTDLRNGWRFPSSTPPASPAAATGRKH